MLHSFALSLCQRGLGLAYVIEPQYLAADRRRIWQTKLTNYSLTNQTFIFFINLY